jgi:hypothetical protein
MHSVGVSKFKALGEKRNPRPELFIAPEINAMKLRVTWIIERSLGTLSEKTQLFNDNAVSLNALILYRQ